MVEGTIFHALDSAMIHITPLFKDVYKVNVHHVYDGMEDMDLIIPTRAQHPLHEEEEILIAWPQHLVMFSKVKVILFSFYMI